MKWFLWAALFVSLVVSQCCVQQLPQCSTPCGGTSPETTLAQDQQKRRMTAINEIKDAFLKERGKLQEFQSLSMKLRLGKTKLRQLAQLYDRYSSHSQSLLTTTAASASSSRKSQLDLLEQQQAKVNEHLESWKEMRDNATSEIQAYESKLHNLFETLIVLGSEIQYSDEDKKVYGEAFQGFQQRFHKARKMLSELRGLATDMKDKSKDEKNNKNNNKEDMKNSFDDFNTLTIKLNAVVAETATFVFRHMALVKEGSGEKQKQLDVLKKESDDTKKKIKSVEDEMKDNRVLYDKQMATLNGQQASFARSRTIRRAITIKLAELSQDFKSKDQSLQSQLDGLTSKLKSLTVKKRDQRLKILISDNANAKLTDLHAFWNKMASTIAAEASELRLTLPAAAVIASSAHGNADEIQLHNQQFPPSPSVKPISQDNVGFSVTAPDDTPSTSSSSSSGSTPVTTKKELTNELDSMLTAKADE